MSKLGLVLVMLLIAGRINAQNYPAPTSDPPTYFVLIQTDSGQAFYVRLDSQLCRSSPAGHLILAQLKDSAYTITIGFPGQIYPEQRYQLNIRQKDWALRLSRQDNRWSLFDGEGQTMPAAVDPSAGEMPLLAGVKKDDAFSQMMAAIVQDTTVMYNNYTATSDSMTSPASADTPSISMVARDSLALHTGVSLSGPSSPTGVVKLSEHKSPQFLSIVYTDHPVDKKTDTIDVVIPVDSPAVTAVTSTTGPDSNTYVVHTDDSIRVERIPKPSSDTIRSASHLPGHALKADTASHAVKPAKAASAPYKSNLPFINSDCHAFATDYDVDKLRVRMLNAIKDDDRIQIAYKIFKTKCFSTNQVSALCAVFGTDAAKFKFLAAAYPFVSDDRFPELIELLTDPVFTGKFRTLTGRH